jgi:GTPase SAR1 family protein
LDVGGAPKARICLVEDAVVGVTPLILRYVEDAFNDRYISTLGGRVSLKKLCLTSRRDTSERTEIQLPLWDLIGERSYPDTLHRA